MIVSIKPVILFYPETSQISFHNCNGKENVMILHSHQELIMFTWYLHVPKENFPYVLYKYCFMSDSWKALSVNVVLCLMVDEYRVPQ